ncbi:DUF3105 domain-containing protein [Nocardioides lianchengensis]|uniref:DUF3105 domain-containing protein n=1 Tax=Nocardioides lianchengensis TaxID=1045774 RepID=A0A1G6R6I8_9ACTN|nr:DUF3105 domain-containing protein [Nocardioides lianchengensis]NYG10346.1 hypothetical protein [Nocardioides lianchengensis]SDD00242.1 Protein of unknown function [Nocardioides lianchengensis]
MSHDGPPPPPPYQPFPTAPPPPAPPGEVFLQSLGETPPPRRTGRLIVALVAAVALVVGAVALPVALLADDPERGPVNLDEVVVAEDLRTDHVTGDQSYPTTPPMGGPHDEVWLDCGVYDVPVRDENVVHDLEHGTVWITYRPGLSDDDVAALTEVLPQNGILSPYDDLPAPVVVTVWGRQLHLDGADDDRLALFLEEYGGGVTAPEQGVTCAGGTPNPTGGTGSSV